jgi:hypothetical protein
VAHWGLLRFGKEVRHFSPYVIVVCLMMLSLAHDIPRLFVGCLIGDEWKGCLPVTLHTTRFNIKNFYVVPTLRLCVLYGSQNKQQLFP